MNLRPSSRHAASLHFDTIDLSTRTGNSQTLSVAIHILLIAALLLLAANPRTTSLIRSIPVGIDHHTPTYIPPADPTQIGRPSHGNDGGGGRHELLPTTLGQLAPHSSRPLLPPTKTINDDPQLAEPSAIFDSNAPAAVQVVPDLGLPWMKDKNGSAGPGGPNGFGGGKGNGMGDRNGNGAGEGDEGGNYANVVTQVMCLYCPEPPYTEEARKNKLQGKMLLRVLVGEDGKARQVRLLQSLGLGLDESAEHAVYSWRFSPARDANRRPVAAWVTIETRFQLF
ncbi:MAG TPA: energy transducer TonB [Dongiaceae bacterium]|nr:energy transducer TonB [Dongiaceae bacterium]